MDIDFFAENPRKSARNTMESVMNRGSDQLAIAIAFCSAAGVALLTRQVPRLKKRDSFVVVSSAPPTDYAELSKLYEAIPENLFVHWGATAPYENKAGTPLMHSKVVYARSGQECWLWVGSHNLTGNATQGGNCEAAVLLHGTSCDKPFVDALGHLSACRGEATPYDPDVSSHNDAQREDILVIHAEGELTPDRNLPCRIHLCLDSADFDGLLSAPAPVRLFLYPRQALRHGWQDANPTAAFSGTLTGVNFTAANPNAKGSGTTAAWSAADFNIAEQEGVLALLPSGQPTRNVTTQAVLYISAPSSTSEALFAERPRVEIQPISGPERLSPIDLDMRRFFRARHIQHDQLLHIPVSGRRQVIRVTESDVRPRDTERIRARVAAGRALDFEDVPERRLRVRHPFIVRAKYRLPD
ncbi:MAG: hypothetical protein V5B34_00275 [Accumulibacter sp.]|jgi:hypothetical protein|uniref:hypothetical protein n=1 Tax=Accumulibacter sp. TaxID=2053492 RepID=UPI002FC33640